MLPIPQLKLSHSPSTFHFILLLLVCLIHGEVAYSQTQASRKGMNCSSVFAISGGGGPSSNHLRYYENIERVHQVFNNCPVSNFIATGDENDKVTMAYESIPVTPSSGPGKAMPPSSVKKIKLNQDGFPVLQAQKAMGGIQGAASYEDIKKGVEDWTKNHSSTQALKPVIFYVTDHGGFSNQQGVITLWNRKNMTPQQLNSILTSIPEDRKVIMLFDECYGGDMLRSIKDSNGFIRKNTCGLAAASPGQLAFNGGGIMRNLLDAKIKSSKTGMSPTYLDLLRNVESDKSIISSPALSSDVFASDWFNKNFTGNLAENIKNNILVDTQKQCLAQLDFTQLSLQSQLPPDLLKELKSTWEEVLREFNNIPGRITQLPQLEEELAKKKQEKDKSFKEFNDFLVNEYNPHMRQVVKDRYTSFDSYTQLKDKMNQGIELTDEEKGQLQTHTQNIDLLTTAIRDEASLKKRKHAISFVHDPSEETQDMVSKNVRLSNKKMDDMNSYFKLKKQVTKLTTLNALDHMIKRNDLDALKTYLNIRGCEKTPIFTP